MNILGQTGKFVTNQILPAVKPKHKKLFSFGLKALTLTPYESLGSNSRLIIKNLSTAASKIYRLTSNKTIIADFHKLVSLSGLVQKTSLVNVDFSTFCGFQTLAMAVQTRAGRAIPVWLNAITYPIKFAGSQNIFVFSEIKALGKCLGFYPRFVFDRGFWIPCVMKFMLEEKIIFYLRIKKGQELLWEKDKKKTKAKLLGNHTKDAVINLYGHKLRLIISPPPPKQTNPKKKQNTERWYIMTNDMETKREDILQTYATRFEIEETFKDLKHIQRLKRLRIKTIQTFIILLWFATLAFWIAWWVNGERVMTKVHPKKKRSYFRIFWEDLQRSIREQGIQRITLELDVGVV